jgi:N6-L-threonylcarbamoyladenine synthase
VLNYINIREQRGEKYNKADVAASFQQAVVDVLAEKTVTAALNANLNTITIAGGVSANGALRDKLVKRAGEKGINVLYPKPILCTDNAAMIASSAYYEYINGNIAGLELNAEPGLSLNNRCEQ